MFVRYESRSPRVGVRALLRRFVLARCRIDLFRCVNEHVRPNERKNARTNARRQTNEGTDERTRTSERTNQQTRKQKKKRARTNEQATRKSWQNRSRDASRTPPGHPRRGQNRRKIAPKRSWRDLGRSWVAQDAPGPLQKRSRTRSGRSPDTPGTSPGRLGTLPGGPGTSPRRLGERSGRVFRATLAKKLAERLAERFSCDFASLASCRATALMCTKHQF